MNYPTKSLIRENSSQIQWVISSAHYVFQTFSQYLENSENMNSNILLTGESHLKGMNKKNPSETTTKVNKTKEKEPSANNFLYFVC